MRAQVPATTRFLPYGHKLGVALVGREVLDRRHGPALARAAAHDVTRYEQQGCYSPHVVYVERGGGVDPRSFAQHLAAGFGHPAHGLAQLQRADHHRGMLPLRLAGEEAAIDGARHGAGPRRDLGRGRGQHVIPHLGAEGLGLPAEGRLVEARDALGIHGRSNGGLLVGAVMLGGLSFAPPVAQRRAAVFALATCLLLLNMLPSNPYFLSTLQEWVQGKFLNFNGAAQFLSLSWPLFALWFLTHRVHRGG